MDDIQVSRKLHKTLVEYRKVCFTPSVVGGIMSQQPLAKSLRSKINSIYPQVSDIIDHYYPTQQQYIEFYGRSVQVFSNLTNSFGAPMFLVPAIESAIAIVEKVIAKYQVDQKNPDIKKYFGIEVEKVLNALRKVDLELYNQVEKVQVHMSSKFSDKLASSILLEVRNTISLLYDRHKDDASIIHELKDNDKKIGEINIVTTFLKQKGASETQLEVISALYHLSSKGKGNKISSGDIFASITGLIVLLIIYVEYHTTT